MLEQMAATPVEDRAVYRIDGAFHDLLSDPKSQEVMGYIIKFINDRAEKMPSAS
jgi:alpha-beta hydrolase superfamily lysophospholipase